jgi:hypothetical protein
LFPSTPWTSCGMAWSLFRAVKQFWYSYPLNCSSDILLFLGRIYAFAKYERAKSKGWKCIYCTLCFNLYVLFIFNKYENTQVLYFTITLITYPEELQCFKAVT